MELLIELIKLLTAFALLVKELRRNHDSVSDDGSKDEKEDR